MSYTWFNLVQLSFFTDLRFEVCIGVNVNEMIGFIYIDLVVLVCCDYDQLSTNQNCIVVFKQFLSRSIHFFLTNKTWFEWSIFLWMKITLHANYCVLLKSSKIMQIANCTKNSTQLIVLDQIWIAFYSEIAWYNIIIKNKVDEILEII